MSWLPRRRFILGVAALAAVGTISWLPSTRTGSGTRIAESLLELAGSYSEIANLGEVYLAAMIEEADVERVLGYLLNAVSGGRTPPRNREAVQRRLAESVQGDYARGDVVLVAGWAVSRTEARLAALAALIR